MRSYYYFLNIYFLQNTIEELNDNIERLQEEAGKIKEVVSEAFVVPADPSQIIEEMINLTKNEFDFVHLFF